MEVDVFGPTPVDAQVSDSLVLSLEKDLASARAHNSSLTEQLIATEAQLLPQES